MAANPEPMLSAFEAVIEDTDSQAIRHEPQAETRILRVPIVRAHVAGHNTVDRALGEFQAWREALPGNQSAKSELSWSARSKANMTPRMTLMPEAMEQSTHIAFRSHIMA